MLDGVLGFEGSELKQVGVEFYALKLAQIAKEMGFDGYLMNFEAELIDVSYVDKLVLFLTLLRSCLKTEVGDHAELIWYDSIDT